MKRKLLAVMAALTLATSSFAMPVKPANCPTADAIRAGGLSKDVVEQDINGMWVVALMQSNFDTQNNWSFVVGQITAQDREDAYAKATASLASVTFARGPLPVTRINRWGCSYNNAANYVAFALTPNLAGGRIASISNSLR
tara:strand:+ start:1895 stop:2317 length:423 start_codon:yes stop_codon:yes gene_type:complete